MPARFCRTQVVHQFHLFALLVCFSGVALGLKVVQLEVGDAQGFADAIAAFGTSGEDTTIKLPYGRVFSVANATIVSAQGPAPFSAGVLTIEPSDRQDGAPEAFTVLDAGMQSGLVSFNGTPSGFTGRARLQLNNIVIINQCDMKVAWDPINTPYLYQRTVYYMALFGHRSRVLTEHFYNHLTQYARQADVAANTWLAIMLRLPPHLKTLSERLGSWTLLTGLAWFDLSTAHAFLGGFNVPGAVSINASFKSITDPDDPLLASLRAEGRLMEPRYCDGDASPPPLLLDPFMPAWLTTDTTGWLGAVSQASKRAAEPNTTFAVPGLVMLVGSALPLVPKSSLSVTPLQGPLLLSGPLNDEPGVVAEGVLDLTGSERPLIQVARGGLLFMQHMKLKGLAARPLPQPANSTGDTQAGGPRSVFPLSAFPLANSSSAIDMFNVTLVLPTADYLALLTLALQGDTASISGCVNASTRAHPAALQAGITSLSLQALSNAPVGYASILLSTFVGWGLNTSGLMLQAEDPSGVWLACQQHLSTGSAIPAGQSCSSQEIAIVAGCTAAGLAALLAVVFGAVWTWHKRLCFVAPHASGHPSTLEDGNAPHAAGDPKPSSKTSSSRRKTPPAFLQDRMHGGAQAQHEPTTAPFLGLEEATDTCGEEPDQPHERSFGVPSFALAPRLACGKRPLRQVVSAAEETVGAKPEFGGENQGRELPGAQVSAAAVVLLSKELPNSAAAGGISDFGMEATHGSVARHDCSRADPRAAVTQLVAEMAGDKEMVEIQELLGTGSWGTVYKGRWRGLDVALKTLVFEVEGSSGQKPRAGVAGQQAAITEAAVAASMDHKNVVRTYHYDIKEVHSKEQPGAGAGGLQIDMVQQDGGYKEFKLFLVQELCAMPLSQALDKRAIHDPKTGQVSEPITVLLLLLDIAQGLVYLHSHNIIHGDLKPANVLLKTSNTLIGVVAKLTDFGLSARMTGSATHVSNYRSGTPFYVAPEVVHEHRTSTASDVFSFGILMWQLYSGLLPCQCSPKGEFSWNPVFPRFQSPNIPSGAFISLTHRCLLRDPRQRPTATQLITQLTELKAP